MDQVTAGTNGKLIKVIGTMILVRPPPPRRPATGRTMNAASIDVTMPIRFATAFQSLLAEESTMVLLKKSGRIVARDLHEKAIESLLQQISDGRKFMFLAPPTRDSVRKKLQIDGRLKVAVECIAESAHVTQASIVMTAFHYFLETVDLLKAEASAISHGA